MTDDNRNSQCENTGAVLRSAIRDSRASSVQARIRITRIERGIEKLQRLKNCAPDKEEASRIELKIRQSLQLREQVLRSLANAETHLQALLKMDRQTLAGYQPTSTSITSKQSAAISSDA